MTPTPKHGASAAPGHEHAGDGDARLLDPLTGAYTREALTRRLPEEIERARRYGHALSLAVIDLDHFKSVNDAFGHQRGDEVLRGFAARAMDTLRSSDLLFRYGGDEFVLLMPGVAAAQGEDATRRLAEVIKARPFGEDPPLTLTLSIGGAAWNEALATPEAFFGQADKRVYEAKRAGRDRAVWADAERPARLDFDAASRLFERDEALEALHGFLDALPQKKHGVLHVAGVRGAGRSRFLQAVAHAAAAQGHAVLQLTGRSGFAHRMHASLLEAFAEEQGPWKGMPTTLDDAAGFVEAVADALGRGGHAGLVVVADGLDRIDRASRALINRLMLRLPVAALAYSAEHDIGGISGMSAATTVKMAPLSPPASHLWLRTVLHTEPPAAFSEWLHGCCLGLPGAMRRWLQRLEADGALRADPRGWTLAGDWPDRAAALDDDMAPRRGNLPELTDMLIGRGEELRLLKQQLAEQPLVTLVAPGGMGKSRLALQLASEAAEGFAGGAWFLPLASVSDPDAVARTIALALGLTLGSRADPRSVLVGHLKDQRALLVLDNFEHLLEAASLVEEIRQGAPGVRVLVTSRERLGLPFESVVDLAGLQQGTPDSLGPAQRLFEVAAREVVQDFAITPESAPAVRRICALVGGMPLAIRLAAAWAGTYRCAEIADELERNMALIAGTRDGSRGAWAAVEYFWQQLSAPERRAVRQLAAFSGGFERKAAQQVAGASPFLLDGLVAKSFLWRKEHGRYELHELLRQFARAQLEARPAELARTRERHGLWCAGLAREAAQHWFTLDEPAVMLRLDRDHPNLIAALDWAVSTGRADAMQALLGALGEYWNSRELTREGLKWCDLIDLDTVPMALRAITLTIRGYCCARQDDSDGALAALEEAVQCARACGDARTESRALERLSWPLFELGRPAEAVVTAEQALAVARDLDVGFQARAWNVLAVLYNSTAQPERAGQAHDRAAELASQAGDLRTLLIVRANEGVRKRWQGEFEVAREHYAEAIDIGRRLGHKQMLGVALTNMGELHIALGDAAGAMPYLEEGREMVLLSSSPAWLSINRCYSGQVLLRQDRVALGLRHLREALALSRQVGSVTSKLLVAAMLAEWLLAHGETERAAALAAGVLAHPTQMRGYSEPARAVFEAARVRLGEREMPGPPASIDEVIDELLDSRGRPMADTGSSTDRTLAAVAT